MKEHLNQLLFLLSFGYCLTLPAEITQDVKGKKKLYISISGAVGMGSMGSAEPFNFE